LTTILVKSLPEELTWHYLEGIKANDWIAMGDQLKVKLLKDEDRSQALKCMSGVGEEGKGEKRRGGQDEGEGR
jgi:hypothetical protein